MRSLRSNRRLTIRWLAGLLVLLVSAGTGYCQRIAALGTPQVAPAPKTSIRLANLIDIALERNPELKAAGFEIEAARGRAVQAGLYPNPVITIVGDELGDRTGPKGVNTLPLVTQEIVTAGKLRLARSVAERETDLAGLVLARQRLILLTTVRLGYFEVIAGQRRVEVLTKLVGQATESSNNAKKLVGAGQAAKQDGYQFEIELERLTAEKEAAERELAAAWRRLAASMGVPTLPYPQLEGKLDAAIPEYDFERARVYVIAVHPEARFAEVAITRADLFVKYQQALRVPNIAIGAGYVRQNQNQSSDYTLQLSVPVPLFNRNQGNIRSAQASYSRATVDRESVQNDLTKRLATAYGQYAASKARVERFRKTILPKAEESYKLTLAAFKGVKFEYLSVLQAQGVNKEANLTYIQAQLDLWRAGSEIAGLLGEEEWPFQK
ncbi:MAG: TolC family protein [Planctomycetes bacterium]|nr:TolC family protein [Planctomycetota bacterium]